MDDNLFYTFLASILLWIIYRVLNDITTKVNKFKLLKIELEDNFNRINITLDILENNYIAFLKEIIFVNNKSRLWRF